MMKDKLIDGKKTVSRFRSKLVKMSRDAGSKFNDYSISPKTRQILLHWGYELTKAKEKYSKEKAAEYYAQNKEAVKEKSRERYKNLSQEEKDKIKEYQKKYIIKKNK